MLTGFWHILNLSLDDNYNGADQKVVDLLCYEIRPRRPGQGVNLISAALPFGMLWYGEPNAAENAVSYARANAGTQRAAIKIFDRSSTIVETCIHRPELRGRHNTIDAL